MRDIVNGPLIILSLDQGTGTIPEPTSLYELPHHANKKTLNSTWKFGEWDVYFRGRSRYLTVPQNSEVSCPRVT
ncbi:hypothetical protein TNCV_2813651 [Trichonephila clavipes]|nr:hypothetical protein TNCV_2813651 [Trichonephila clavipes]